MVDGDTLPSTVEAHIHASQQLSELIGRVGYLRRQLIYPKEVRLNEQLFPLTLLGLAQRERTQIVHDGGLSLDLTSQLLSLELALQLEVHIGQVLTNISQVTGF